MSGARPSLKAASLSPGRSLIRQRIPAHFRASTIPAARRGRESLRTTPQFYADAAVVAYRRPADDVPLAIASSGDHIERRLAGSLPCSPAADLEKTTQLPIAPRRRARPGSNMNFPRRRPCAPSPTSVNSPARLRAIMYRRRRSRQIPRVERRRAELPHGSRAARRQVARVHGRLPCRHR